MTPPSARPYRRRKLRVEANLPQLAFAKQRRKALNRLLLTLRGTATGSVGALSAKAATGCRSVQGAMRPRAEGRQSGPRLDHGGGLGSAAEGKAAPLGWAGRDWDTLCLA